MSSIRSRASGDPGPSEGPRFGVEVARLALPALGALLSQPIFLLADSVIVGHLGTPPLAGLAVAGSLLTFTVSTCVFLTFGATAVVSRRVGAGDSVSAVAEGAQFVWIGALVGLVLVGLWSVAGRLVVAHYGVTLSVQHQADEYLGIAAWGLPPALVLMATTGVFRGLQDTWTTLAIAATSAALNIVLNVVFVYGLGLGIAGSAAGTTTTQYLAAVGALALIWLRAGAIASGLVSFRRAGLVLVVRTSLPLLVRTLTLVVPLLWMTWAAARCGTVALAAHQITSTIWNALTLGMDSLAVAAQAMVGRRLGAAEVAAAHVVARRLVRYGVVAGVALSALLIATNGLYERGFTDDARVARTMTGLMVVVALSQPVSGAVFVLDGLLIGAGDFTYLARAGVVNALVWLPPAIWVVLGTRSITAVWLSWVLFMLTRLATLGWRAARHDWAVAGGSLPNTRPGRRRRMPSRGQ